MEQLGSRLYPQITPTRQALQAAFVARRFRVSAPVAGAIASLAFAAVQP